MVVTILDIGVGNTVDGGDVEDHKGGEGAGGCSPRSLPRTPRCIFQSLSSVSNYFAVVMSINPTLDSIS